MLLDMCVFSDAQTIAGSAAILSTNIIDTEVASSNLGGGTPVWLVVRVNTAFAQTTSAVTSIANVNLLHGLASGTVTQTLLSGQVISIATTASLTANLGKGADLLTVPLPIDNLRYLRIQWQPGGSGFSAGNIDAYLTTAAPRN
jgi:hypothetical protein